MWTRLRNKFLEWVVTKVFEKEFRFFKYPFESIDSILSSMPKDEREEYLLEVKRHFKSKAYAMEATEMKKLLYKELSISTSNEFQRVGYRLCLLYIRKLDRRYKYLCDKLKLDEVIDKNRYVK